MRQNMGLKTLIFSIVNVMGINIRMHLTQYLTPYCLLTASKTVFNHSYAKTWTQMFFK